MYEYKFVKLSFTKDEVGQDSFFDYQKIIEKNADQGWRLNNLFQISAQETESLDLIFEREKQCEKENSSKTQLIIHTFSRELKTLIIDDDFWENIKCIVGFSDWIEIYRKRGRPSTIFHHHFLQGVIGKYYSSHDDEFTSEELSLLRERFKGASTQYFNKDSGFKKFWEIAREKNKLVMTYDSFESFEELDMEDVYYRIYPKKNLNP